MQISNVALSFSFSRETHRVFTKQTLGKYRNSHMRCIRYDVASDSFNEQGCNFETVVT